jgi:hypothetical protein
LVLSAKVGFNFLKKSIKSYIIRFPNKKLEQNITKTVSCKPHFFRFEEHKRQNFAKYW